MAERRPRYNALAKSPRGFGPLSTRTGRIVALSLAAVVALGLLVFILTRPSNSHESQSREDLADRVSQLESADWLAVTVDYSGFTSEGTLHDGTFVGDTSAGDISGVPVVGTGTDTYVDGNRAVWERLGYVGDTEGWVHLEEAGLIPQRFSPSLGDVLADAEGDGTVTLASGYVVFGDYRAKPVGDNAVEVRGPDMVVTYRPGSPDDTMDDTVRVAISTQANAIRQDNGTTRIDAPAPAPAPEPERR